MSELEQLLVLLAAGGNTDWHYAITRNAHYAPHFSNSAGAAGGRAFPSAAGFHGRRTTGCAAAGSPAGL